MGDSPNIVRVGALIADNARAEVLSALMSDRALTATELADIAGVTKQTISSHLAKLLDAGLISVAQQGRHRYFRLAGPDVAQLIESLMGMTVRIAPAHIPTGPRDPALRNARICYDHLAGELGVLAYDGMLRQQVLHEDQGSLRVTDEGREWFQRIGIDTKTLTGKRALCRACLDWSERRYHLAGALGAAFLSHIYVLGWGQRDENSRAIRFTESGEEHLRELFTR